MNSMDGAEMEYNKRVLKINSKETSLIVLKELKKGNVSGKQLSEKLGLSRTAIWKAVEKLRSAGYNIESKKGKGYKLISTPEFSVYEIADICYKNGIEELYQFKEIDSTNTFLKKLVSEKPVRAFVISEKQSAGRGRLNRKWFSDLGGLYFSLSMDVIPDIEKIPLVTLTTGVAIARALRKYADVKIKWPNDLILRDKKLGGILCELTGETEKLWTIIGIGININNTAPLESATSFKDENINVNLIDILKNVLKKLFIYINKLKEGEWDKIREEWISLSSMLNKKVKIFSAGKVYEGIAVELDEKGALVIECNGDLKKIYSGDCFYT